VFIDSADKGSLDVQCVNEYEQLIYSLLDRYPLSKFASSQLHVLLHGMSPINIIALRAIAWCSKLGSFRTKISLVGLNIADVYEDRLRVVGKGNKERFVYFGTPCRKAIDEYLLERNKKVLTDNRALFGSRNGERISASAVHRLVKKALAQAGLDADQFSAHKLRHTAATLMLSGGVDVKTVQDVLGHENLNTTQIYTHIESTELKIAAEANPIARLEKDFD
jgi:site-specific recombinase XerD